MMVRKTLRIVVRPKSKRLRSEMLGRYFVISLVVHCSGLYDAGSLCFRIVLYRFPPMTLRARTHEKVGMAQRDHDAQ